MDEGVGEETLLAAAREAYQEGTRSGYRMSLIEADKLLDHLLTLKNAPGATREERFGYLKGRVESFERLARAHAKATEIAEKTEYSLSLESVKEHLTAYREAVGEIKAWPRIKDLAKKTTEHTGRLKAIGISKIIFYLTSAIAIELFFTETTVGSSLITGFFNALNAFLGKLAIAAAIGLLLALGLSALFLLYDRIRSRKR